MINSQSSENENRPRIGITLGDVAGIGVEIILKALTDNSIKKSCLPIIIGDARFLVQNALDLGLKIDFEIVKKGEQIPLTSDKIIIYDLANLNQPIEIGIESGAAGKAAGEYIEAAVQLCLDNQIEAIATAPINKKSLAMGGYNFPGHTEMLAHLTDTKEFAMSFFADKLRVVLL